MSTEIPIEGRMMNKERILQLADHLETLEHKAERVYPRLSPEEAMDCFTMTSYTYSCGAPACMAGWAVDLFGDEEKLPTTRAAAQLLDIPLNDAQSLFCGFNTNRAYESPFMKDITPQMAAATLRRYVETGEVRFDNE